MQLDARGITLVRRIDAEDVRVLDGVDLSLGTGELVDVVGPSGSGKSTLLLALARLLPGVRGDLALDGRPAAEWSPEAWRTRVTLLPQKPALVPGTVADNLLLPWRLKVRAAETPPTQSALAEALASVGLADVAPERDAARLSVGQQARVALLRVLLAHPEALLLDEPDAALDDESAAQVTAAIVRFVAEGGAAVRVRHLRSDAHATRRYRMAVGRLAEADVPVGERDTASPSEPRGEA